MEEGSSRRSKRPFVEDDDSNKAPEQKRVSQSRVPVRRNQITAELLDEENEGEIADISRAEVEYEENETFIDDGIAIEPFNRNKERRRLF
ncbi:hypothetical protein HAX54_002533 [Datura stramonium]|uniref:Uncharacterized protein n=1 Tax=Datura stramonium TaxID=4076 RepID=A0ABS8T6A9_DATST|nr:hypothetical protein [Datura stramonium]